MSVAVMAVLLAVIGLPSRSQAASTFSASAGGEIVRASLKLVPALLAEEILDPGAVTAQASLTSFGESTAFASTPFPGAVPVSAPGLIDGLLGSTPGIPPELLSIVNVPDYPLIATSSSPSTPSSNVTVGPLSMDAQSRSRESAAVTTDGVNRTEARVLADETSDVVTARAVTVVGSIDVGPLVQLGGVRSSATVTQDADGELDRATEFSVANLSVLGTRLRVTDAGIELAGVNLPLGLGGILDPVQDLLGALQDQGTSIRFIDATETTEGVISAGLVVESEFDLGVNGIRATATITVGRTFASVSNAARGGFGDIDLPDTGGGGDVGTVDVGSDFGGGLAPVGGALPSTPVRPNAPAAVGGTERISALVPDETDLGGFYPVLAVGGAVFLIGISLFRKIGVRSTWTS